MQAIVGIALRYRVMTGLGPEVETPVIVTGSAGLRRRAGFPAVVIALRYHPVRANVSPGGTRLGAYEIKAPLGAGGMDEVYHATDPRLARDVATKILPTRFSSDPGRRSRFEREPAPCRHSAIRTSA
jgi:serine/threonine protein kinase